LAWIGGGKKIGEYGPENHAYDQDNA